MLLLMARTLKLEVLGKSFGLDPKNRPTGVGIMPHLSIGSVMCAQPLESVRVS